jgi:uncharacterized peroxidase-related enzyme
VKKDIAWIETVDPDDATGDLARQYEAAVKRAGRVYNVVAVQGLNPSVMEASLALYQHLMQGPSSLSRAEREMVAVVVSRANDCFY